MKLVLFDLDNTLLNGDSDYAWGQFLISQGIVDPVEYEARNDEFYRQYQAGTLDIHAFLAFQLAPLTRYSLEQLNRWHTEFMHQTIAPMITPQARQLVKQALADADLVAIITATNSFVTRPIADAFGVEHLIATEPEQINHRFTGNVSGTPSFREGKITRLNSWLGNLGHQLTDFDESWFYSDSRNDLPLLNAVTHPVAVNADPILNAHAIAHHWPQIDLHGTD